MTAKRSPRAAGSLARVAVLAALAFAGAIAARAQEAWPDHTVRIIVPTAAGGSIDVTARVIAGKLQEIWKQSVIVENRPGAAMRIGADAVAKAAPDGYTLLVAHDGTMAMNAVVYHHLSFDPVKDFEPLPLVASIPEVLLVSTKVPAQSTRDLIALATKEPGRLNHASGGTATLLALELFKAMAKVDINSVPYAGGAPAVNALIGGEADVLFADVATGAAALQAPSVRTLAVTTRNRQKLLPDTPTIDESGVPGYDVKTWIGLFAPARTPKPIVDKIERDVARAMQSPDVRARLEKIGMEMGAGTSAEMRDTLAADIAKWGKLVADSHIEIEQN